MFWQKTPKVSDFAKTSAVASGKTFSEGARPRIVSKGEEMKREWTLEERGRSKRIQNGEKNRTDETREGDLK
jgi:hypothetical protein